MTPRTAGAFVFAANLAAFCVCACVAFARNINALFYHYDGSYMLVDARDQLSFGQPLFQYANNFLQSVGNIQFPQNARLLFFYWPLGWFSDLHVAKVASCLIVAVAVFVSTFALARLLSQPRMVGFIAGWILGFLASPFVPLWFFSPFLYITPTFLAVVVVPLAAFCLIELAGRRSNLVDDLACGLGLLALSFYALAAVSILIPVIAIGVIPYLALALCLVRDRHELLRKLAVLAATLVVAIGLRWPWYVLGLFLNSAPSFFPDDFTVVYHDEIYASVLFQGKLFGWGGPVLVALAALGAVFSLKSVSRELRVAAKTQLIMLAFFIVAALVLIAAPHWILPPPIYFEVAIWPLYAVFVAIAVLRIFDFAAARIARVKLQWGRVVLPQWLVPLILFALATGVVLRRPPTPSGYPFPPRITPVVATLKANIAIDASSPFKGRILTAMPVEPGGRDAWTQQFDAATAWARVSGNDEMSIGLWYFRIPTLFEYNQFISPDFHLLIKHALQRPPVTHQRNITVLDYPNSRILRLLGVRYVLMPHPDAALGELRAAEDRKGVPWGLVELPAPNLATYSPTSIEARRDLTSMLDFVVNDRVDLSKQAVSWHPIDGALVPIRSSALSMAGRDLRVVADSDGRSLLVVPVQFSHCLELRGAHPGEGAEPTTLSRIDGALTGIVFQRHLDAVLSFRVGPLHNPTCRWQDYRDLQALLPGAGGGR